MCVCVCVYARARTRGKKGRGGGGGLRVREYARVRVLRRGGDMTIKGLWMSNAREGS